MAYRPITHRLSDELLQSASAEIVGLLAESELSVRQAAKKAEVPERTFLLWLKVALERGVDIRAQARQRLQAQGVDLGALPAERIRGGIVRATTEGRSKRKDRARKVAARGVSAVVPSASDS